MLIDSGQVFDLIAGLENEVLEMIRTPDQTAQNEFSFGRASGTLLAAARLREMLIEELEKSRQRERAL